MSGKQILNVEKPATQTVKAVCALLAWKGRSSNPLPQFVELGNDEGRVVLVLSNKKDAYYVTTAAECSCPAAIYHHGPCKHQRRYFPQEATTKPAGILADHKPFKPFLEDEARAVKVSSIPLVDCLGEPNNREVAYHEIMETRQYWPLEA